MKAGDLETLLVTLQRQPLAAGFDAQLRDQLVRQLEQFDPQNANDRELLVETREYLDGKLAGRVFRAYLREALASTGKPMPPIPTPPTKPADTLTGTKAGETREITLPGGVKLNQVWCPPGSFTMGTPGATDDEAPVQVTLTKGYWLGPTEVTQAQWTAVRGTASKPWSGTQYVKEGPDFPDSNISHGVNPEAETIEGDSATAICQKLTEFEWLAGRLPTGWKYALPTEAQWEYACRAGTKTRYSFGDDGPLMGKYGWSFENAYAINEDYAHTVGTKKPNPWGLFHMHGNVQEWCQDAYEAKLPRGTDPLGGRCGPDGRSGQSRRQHALWARVLRVVVPLPGPADEPRLHPWLSPRHSSSRVSRVSAGPEGVLVAEVVRLSPSRSQPLSPRTAKV